MSAMNFCSFELQLCCICGRSFRLDVLERHEHICRNTRYKKRKVFDSSKQRTRGIDKPSIKYILEKESADHEKRIAQIQNRKHNWRRKHKAFISTIRTAKHYAVATSLGLQVPPPPPIIDPDFIQCAYCLRRFNEKAADRHIPFCRERHNRFGPQPLHRPKSISRPTSACPSRSGDNVVEPRTFHRSVTPRPAIKSPRSVRHPQEGDVMPSFTPEPLPRVAKKEASHIPRMCISRRGSSISKNDVSPARTSTSVTVNHAPSISDSPSCRSSVVTKRDLPPSGGTLQKLHGLVKRFSFSKAR